MKVVMVLIQITLLSSHLGSFTFSSLSLLASQAIYHYKIAFIAGFVCKEHSPIRPQFVILVTI